MDSPLAQKMLLVDELKLGPSQVASPWVRSGRRGHRVCAKLVEAQGAGRDIGKLGQIRVETPPGWRGGVLVGIFEVWELFQARFSPGLVLSRGGGMCHPRADSGEELG